MRKTLVLSALLLLVLLPSFCRSADFTFTAGNASAKILTLKLSQTGTGAFSIKDVKIRLGSGYFTLDNEKLTVKTPAAHFTLFTAGGSSVSVSADRLKLGFSFIPEKTGPAVEQPWYFDSARHSSFHHYIASALFRTSSVNSPSLELEFTTHLDRLWGIRTDLRALTSFSIRGIRISVERTFTDETKTKAVIELGSFIRVSLKKMTGPPPVFGGSARVQETEMETRFRMNAFTAEVKNIFRISRTTGSVSRTSYSVKLDTKILTLKAASTLSRTDGSPYVFSPLSVELAIKMTRTLDTGELTLQIRGDRSFEIGFRSEIPHTGAGEFGLTGNIDP